MEKKPRIKEKKKYTTKKQNKKNLLAALRKNLSVVTTSCKQANVCTKTYYVYYQDDADFANECDEIKQETLDFVESKHYENIDRHNVPSIIFHLKTKGKERGYVERTEQQIHHTIDKISITRKDDDEDIDDIIEQIENI